MKIKINELIKNKITYPNWSTGSTYFLNHEKINKNQIKIFYKIDKGVKRKISRIFPSSLECDSKFWWILGLIKGEGSNAKGKSSYRRFTFTNSDYKLMKSVLIELNKKDLLKTSKIPNNAFHLIHFQGTDEEVINYWSTKLKLPKEKFKCFEDERKTTKYGVCHLYINDVLLRRIIDLLNEKISRNL